MTTICANLIVKNESHCIRRCLDSLAPYVNSFCIVDTGSTDGTQEIIKTYPNAVLYEQPWVNFGWNREQALAFAQDLFLTASSQSNCILFMDADDVLQAPPGFQWPELTLPGYTLPIHYGDTKYSRCCLVRADAPWRWEGAVHEFLTSDVPLEQGVLTEPHIVVMHDGARSKDPDTYKKDAALLEIAEPTPRNIFYLAQSYRDSGQNEKALATYQRRAAMLGWEEEGWYSTYEVAKLMERLDEESWKVIGAYLMCHQRRSSRAEPLFNLSRYCRLKGWMSLAYLFAREAASIPQPGDKLFVDSSVYDWRALDELGMSAYYVEKFEGGRVANERLLREGKLPASELLRVQKNLSFYEGKSK